MKKNRVLNKALILAGICTIFSCSPKQTHKVTISIDKICTLEQQKIAYDVINKRITVLDIIEKTDLRDGKFDLTYAIEKQDSTNPDSLLTQILTQRGDVYVTEIYKKNEIQSSLDRVYERLFWLVENTNHKPLWRMDSFQTDEPNLINVQLEQLSFIDSIFNSFQRQFPTGTLFAWTAKPNRDEYFDLLPLKTLHKFPLNPISVKYSKIQNKNGYQELSIDLNREYVEEWASMTRNNISRSLAIVMDGKVLMSPRVYSEIVGGKLVIVGDFNNNELSLIKSVIMSGVLNCKVKITNQ